MEKGTVKLGIDYYEMLVRDSEKLRVVEAFVERSSYFSEKEMRIILEMQDAKEIDMSLAELHQEEGEQP